MDFTEIPLSPVGTDPSRIAPLSLSRLRNAHLVEGWAALDFVS